MTLINKPLARSTQVKEKTQITDVRKKIADYVKTYLAAIKKTFRKYYEQLYFHKFNNLRNGPIS